MFILALVRSSRKSQYGQIIGKNCKSVDPSPIHCIDYIVYVTKAIMIHHGPRPNQGKALNRLIGKIIG